MYFLNFQTFSICFVERFQTSLLATQLHILSFLNLISFKKNTSLKKVITLYTIIIIKYVYALSQKTIMDEIINFRKFAGSKIDQLMTTLFMYAMFSSGRQSTVKKMNIIIIQYLSIISIVVTLLSTIKFAICRRMTLSGCQLSVLDDLTARTQ